MLMDNEKEVRTTKELKAGKDQIREEDSSKKSSQKLLAKALDQKAGHYSQDEHGYQSVQNIEEDEKRSPKELKRDNSQKA